MRRQPRARTARRTARPMLAGLVLVLAAASASAASEAASPWDGPWHPSVTAQSAERFVQTWSVRVANPAWFGPYLEAESFPPAVLGEGYHSLDPHTKMYLVRRLFDRLSLTLPSLAAELAQAAGRATLDEQRNLLYLFVFDKEWVKALRARDEAPARASSFEPSTALRAQLERLAVVTPAPAMPALDRPGAGAPVPALDFLDYRLCAQSSALSTCSADVPLGATVPLDTTGDGVPDVAGRLSPDVNLAYPAGLSVSLTVTRLGTSSVPAHVYAILEAPVPMRFTAGFDGRASSLAPSSTAVFTVRNLAEAVAGTLGASVAIEHVSPAAPLPSSIALTFGMRTLTYAPSGAASESNPINASLTFAPVPASWNAAMTLSGGAQPDGSKRTTFVYTASGSAGPLTANVVRGGDVLDAYLSNVPSSVNVTATVGNPTSRVTLATSQSIGLARASVRRTGSGVNEASVELAQVPTSVDLSFGRISVTSGSDSYTVPGLHYAANASTLDVNAFVDASLFGGDVTARVTLGVANLGAAADIYLQGSALRFTSTPATSSAEIHAWGRISYMRSFSFCVPSSCPTFRLRMFGHAGVVPLTVNDLGLAATNVSSLRVLLGLTSGIDGSFGTFQFGWGSMTVSADFEVTVDACVSGWCATIVSASLHGTFPLNVLFHLGTPHSATWWHANTPVPCSFTSTFDIHVNINPHPHFASWNGFAVAPSGEGGAWTVIPNPNGLLPSAAMEAVAAFTSPYGGGFGVSFPCH